MLHLRADNLSRLPNVAHGFFGRTGGVSTGIFASLNCGPGSGDERENVIENRRRALAALSSSADSRILTVYQIHSANALVVTGPWEFDNRPQADAMVTNVPGLALGILTADCAPLLFADGIANVIGAAHAGWKGALAGVIESAVSAMEHLGARRDRIVAAIGPCIRQSKYEVGHEMRDHFLRSSPGNAQFFVASEQRDHWRFDLGRYVAHAVDVAGIEDVARLGGCTYAQEPEFFSFRRATHRGERDYGRQLSAILLTR
jgi:YfiH family protein